jgi:hypothetical protein
MDPNSSSLFSITISYPIPEQYTLSPATQPDPQKRILTVPADHARRSPVSLTLSWVDLVIGAVLGISVAGILGYIMGQIRWARGQVGAASRPQSVGHQTAQTPLQVVRGSIAAFFSCIFWTIILILFLIVVVALIYGYFVGFNYWF